MARRWEMMVAGLLLVVWSSIPGIGVASRSRHSRQPRAACLWYISSPLFACIPSINISLNILFCIQFLFLFFGSHHQRLLFYSCLQERRAYCWHLISFFFLFRLLPNSAPRSNRFKMLGDDRCLLSNWQVVPPFYTLFLSFSLLLARRRLWWMTTCRRRMLCPDQSEGAI